MEYYPINLIRHACSHYFIWEGNDDVQPDQILVADNSALKFCTLEELGGYAKSQEIIINPAAVLKSIDIDVVAGWAINDDDFPAEEVLNAWNILGDFWQLESFEWQVFRAQVDQASEVHYALSQMVISGNLSKGNLDLKRLHHVIQSGIHAFDLSVVR